MSKPPETRGSGDIRPGYWFKPKTFGFGATPATWQGWLATLAMVAASAAIANFATHGHPAFLVLFAPLVLGFIWLCWVKTDGGWHWRSGARD